MRFMLRLIPNLNSMNETVENCRQFQIENIVCVYYSTKSVWIRYLWILKLARQCQLLTVLHHSPIQPCLCNAWLQAITETDELKDGNNEFYLDISAISGFLNASVTYSRKIIKFNTTGRHKLGTNKKDKFLKLYF